jgi:acylphosphatase
MLVCQRVYYSGRVQGVGFRHTTRGLAKGFPVSGFVRNLSDGRVEVVAEGAAADVDAFLTALAGTMVDYIDRQSVEDMPAQGFQGFVIRVA